MYCAAKPTVTVLQYPIKISVDSALSLYQHLQKYCSVPQLFVSFWFTHLHLTLYWNSPNCLSSKLLKHSTSFLQAAPSLLALSFKNFSLDFCISWYFTIIWMVFASSGPGGYSNPQSQTLTPQFPNPGSQPWFQPFHCTFPTSSHQVCSIQQCNVITVKYLCCLQYPVLLAHTIVNSLEHVNPALLVTTRVSLDSCSVPSVR